MESVSGSKESKKRTIIF